MIVVVAVVIVAVVLVLAAAAAAVVAVYCLCVGVGSCSRSCCQLALAAAGAAVVAVVLVAVPWTSSHFDVWWKLHGGGGSCMGVVEGVRDGRGTVGLSWCDAMGNPWVDSHGTHTHQCGYGFMQVRVWVDPRLPMGYP